MTNTATRTTAPPVIVYDGACAYCRRQVAWIQKKAAPGAFEYLPRQDASVEARFPRLAEQDFNTGLRLVMPDATILVGADAVYAIARRLSGWRLVALLYRVPGLYWFFRQVYAWIARNRSRLAGRCDESCDLPTR